MTTSLFMGKQISLVCSIVTCLSILPANCMDLIENDVLNRPGRKEVPSNHKLVNEELDIILNKRVIHKQIFETPDGDRLIILKENPLDNENRIGRTRCFIKKHENPKPKETMQKVQEVLGLASSLAGIWGNFTGK